MSNRLLSTLAVSVLCLPCIGIGGAALLDDYARFHVSSVTVGELASLQPDQLENFRITDGVVDIANATDSKAGEAIVPVRSRTDLSAPVSVVILFPEPSKALRNNPRAIDLIGSAVRTTAYLPELKVPHTPQMVAFYSGEVNRPYGPKLLGDVLLACGPIILALAFILGTAGIGTRSIHLVRPKPRDPN